MNLDNLGNIFLVTDCFFEITLKSMKNSYLTLYSSKTSTTTKCGSGRQNLEKEIKEKGIADLDDTCVANV